jgi:hypothetical protein
MSAGLKRAPPRYHSSNICMCVGDPDGVQEEHKRFILVRAEECPTSSGGGESCIILHRSACNRGYKQVREGGAPRSQDVSGVCVFTSSSLERSLPAPFIVSRRCRVTKCLWVV